MRTQIAWFNASAAVLNPGTPISRLAFPGSGKIILLDPANLYDIQESKLPTVLRGAILRTTSSVVLCAAALLLSVSAPVFAHHGFSVEFDKDSPLTLTGTVTKMEFMNPHIYFYLDVKGTDGKIVNWAFEGGPPNVIYRQGWRKDTLKPGDVVTVKGFRAKDGTYLAACSTVKLPDGREVSAGSGGVSQNSYGSAAAPDGKK
jgi:hypothetical protein